MPSSKLTDVTPSPGLRDSLQLYLRVSSREIGDMNGSKGEAV